MCWTWWEHLDEPVQLLPAEKGWRAVYAPDDADYDRLTVEHLFSYPVVAWCIYRSSSEKLARRQGQPVKVVERSCVRHHAGAVVDAFRLGLQLSQPYAPDCDRGGDLLAYSPPGETDAQFLFRFKRDLESPDEGDEQ